MTRLRAGSMFVGLGKLLWAKKVPVAQYVVGPGHWAGPARLETHTWRVHFVTNSTCLFRFGGRTDQGVKDFFGNTDWHMPHRKPS